MIDQTLRSGPRLTFGVSLLTKTLPRFSIAELFQEVQALLADTGAELEVDETQTRLTRIETSGTSNSVWSRASEPPKVGLVVNGITVVVEGHDRPGLTAQMLRDVDLGAMPDGRAIVARSRAHVEITELRSARLDTSDLDANHDRATALTVVALAVARITDSIATIWHSSGIVLPMTGLDTAVEDLREGTVPVNLWLSYTAGSSAPGRIQTRGLYPLLGMEIEVNGSGLSSKDGFDVALDMAARVSSGGGVPRHGERVSFRRAGEFVISQRSGDRPASVPVLVLQEAGRSAQPEVKAGAA